MRFAHLESRIVLAKLAYTFDWELTNEGQIDWYRDIRLQGFLTLPDVFVRFTPRVGVKRVNGQTLVFGVNDSYEYVALAPTYILVTKIPDAYSNLSRIRCAMGVITPRKTLHSLLS